MSHRRDRDTPNEALDGDSGCWLRATGCGSWWDGLGRPQKWVFGVVGFGLLALLPLYTPPFLDTPGISFGGTMAQFAMVAIIAIGLNVVVGQAGLLDLGYVGFYAVGAYTVALLTSPDSPWNQMGATGFFSKDWAWLSCVPMAMAVTALAGLILGTPTLRLRGDYLAIVTLGFGEIIRLLADNLSDITNGSRGLNQIAYPRVGESERLPNGVFSSGNSTGDANYGTWWFWLGLVLMIGILLLVGNLERSRVGRAWVAIREDEDAAEVMGVNTFRFKLWAFVIGAGDRRPVRSAVRRSGAVRRADQLQHHQLDAVPRARWCSAARATSWASSSARSSSSTCPTGCSAWSSSASTSAT